MHPYDANMETCSHKSSFMGPLQNFWWVQTSKIFESQDSKQKYVRESWSLRPFKVVLDNDSKEFVRADSFNLVSVDISDVWW